MSHYSIGQLAEQAGADVETVRYYERVGLLPEPPRTAGGHRVYGPAHLSKLKFIRRGRELGLKLGDIRTLAGLADGAEPERCGDVYAVTLHHLADIRSKIADLRRLEAVLEDLTAQCQDGAAPACPVIEALAKT